MIWKVSDTVDRYFGKDAENFLESINYHKEIEILGKECCYSKGEIGVIIGVEDNLDYSDYYWIIYLPQRDTVVYELVNNAMFIKDVII